MAIKVVNHLNYIEYPAVNSTQSDMEVFCKRHHAVIAPTVSDCSKCPYFAGVMQGQGHECTWEDVVPAEVDEVIVNHSDRQKELLRVSRWIDKGYIKRG